MSTHREVVVGGNHAVAVASAHSGDRSVLLPKTMEQLVDPGYAQIPATEDVISYGQRLLLGEGLLGAVAARTSAPEVDMAARVWSEEVLGLYNSSGDNRVNPYTPLLSVVDRGLGNMYQKATAPRQKLVRNAALRARYELQLGRARNAADLGVIALQYDTPNIFMDTLEVMHEAISQQAPINIYDQHPLVLRSATRVIKYLKVNPPKRVQAITDRLYVAAGSLAQDPIHQSVIALARGVQQVLADVPERDLVSVDNLQDYPRAVGFVVEKALTDLYPTNSEAMLKRIERLKQVVLHTAAPLSVVK